MYDLSDHAYLNTNSKSIGLLGVGLCCFAAALFMNHRHAGTRYNLWSRLKEISVAGHSIIPYITN